MKQTAVFLLVVARAIAFAEAFMQNQARWQTKHPDVLRFKPVNTALAVVADPEKEERQHSKEDENDWIQTKNGGFLPNLRQRAMFSKTTKRPSTQITSIEGIEQYKREVVDEDDRIVCVRFYATWCRSCKAITPAFRKLPTIFPSVKFCEVPVTKGNAYLHQGLGIKSLPFAHIFHPEVGLVEELKIGKKNFKSFVQSLKSYVEGICDLPVEEVGDEEEERI